MSKDKSNDASGSETPERLMFDSFYKDTPHKPKDIHYWAAILGIIASITSLIGLIFGALSWMTPAAATHPRKYRILVPLQANSSEYSAYMQREGNVTFEGRYTNKASQNIREIVNAAQKQWLADPNQRVLPGKDDIDFFCFPEGHEGEKESFERAFDHALKAAKAADREVVAVLGNVSSTSTLKYGDFCGTHKLPMILPLATATNLLHELGVRKVPAVLRLPPPNDKQAQVISDFLLNQKNIQQTVVVKDLTNDAWSRDLVDNFRESYVQKPLSDPKAREAGKFGHIISVVPVGGPETQPFLYSILGGSPQEDALLVIGMTNASVETLTQAKTSNANYTYTILTDGAVDEYLDRQIISIQGEKALHNLYLAFPVPCVMPEALKGYIKAGPSLNVDDFKMTHALYVADGAYIIMSMLNNGLKDNAEASGRQIIIDAIDKLRSDAKQRENDMLARGELPKEPVGQPINFTLPFNIDGSRQYIIDKAGNNINASYYLFNIVAAPTGKSSIDWKRAKDMPPSPLKCSEEAGDGSAARTQSH
jgi:hypothetical protein